MRDAEPARRARRSSGSFSRATVLGVLPSRRQRRRSRRRAPAGPRSRRRRRRRGAMRLSARALQRPDGAVCRRMPRSSVTWRSADRRASPSSREEIGDQRPIAARGAPRRRAPAPERGDQQRSVPHPASSRARAIRRRGSRVERLVRLDHPLEQAGLGLVLDVADGERADADRLRAGDRHAIVVHVDALDAGRRHGVDVGGDEKSFVGLLELVGVSSTSRRRRRQKTISASRTTIRASSPRSLPSAHPTSTSKRPALAASARFARAVAVIADEGDLGALQRRDARRRRSRRRRSRRTPRRACP